MRLAQIKLAGFKSFVEPTIISISQDLVGIVGPNGCGKSNIIDAVRWVLGESKASALRGDSMQDVIFSGSDKRKAVGRASVEIVFDNHLNKITGQWSSYSEIAIKRILQRDGLSSYYINNLQVRRRDIADLFLGTGIGGRGYAIIEQGMISRIIEAKPQELRSFLEEAAGISQYRERRQETSLRLAESRKNLTRLEDIGQELATQLQHLEVQAKAARQYKSLQEKLHHSQSLLWLLRQTEAMRQRDHADQEIRKLEAELQSTLANQQQAEKEYEEMRTKEVVVNDNLLQIQGQLYAADAQIGRLEQDINHLQNTQERLIQQIKQVENQLQKKEQLKKEKLENLTHWHREKKNAELTRQEHICENDEENGKLPALEAEFAACQETLNQFRNNLLLIEQASRLEDNHATHATKNIQQLEARQARLLKEQSEFAHIDLDQFTPLQREMEQTENALHEEQQKHQEIEHQLAAATGNQQSIARKIQELQHVVSQATARFTALQNLQQKLENNQNLATWLREQQLDALPRLWQKIQIQAEWEIALEAVLRERLNSIELEQLDSVQNWIAGAPSGKWAIFEKTQPAVPDDLQETRADRKLLAYISVGEPKIQSVLNNWLGKVYAAEDMQAGLSKRFLLNPGDMLVTRQGHIITRDSITFYAPDSQLHGVLSRQQELIQTQREIEQLKIQWHEQRHLLAEAEQQCAELSGAIRITNENSKRLQQHRHTLQLETVKLSQIKEHKTRRDAQIHAELAEIRQALDHEIALQESAKARLMENMQQKVTLQEHTQQAQLAWEAVNLALTNQRQNIQHSSQKLQQAVFYVTTCQNKISEIALSLQAIEEELQKLSEHHAGLCKEVDHLDIVPLNQRMAVAQAQRELIAQAASQARREVDNTARDLREIENTRMALVQKSHALRDAANQARLKEQAASLTIRQFDELIRDARVDTEQLLPLLAKKNAAALQAGIHQLDTEIAALGSVNLAALDELETARARESALQAQLQDLNAAIATLENAIRQIDRETQLRLQDTFMQVNNYLGEIFPVIFTGGKARLEFSDERTADAGLLLMAQPPGKKNNSLHLLSGGEKALTALALVFSLFRLNPAPFCLLDEVDAPLDDSNTGRFCELVKNMAQQTQFIFISHNKITMEMAQRLIGVTMQEQGVSRIVTVDLADAIQMAKQNKQPVN